MTWIPNYFLWFCKVEFLTIVCHSQRKIDKLTASNRKKLTAFYTKCWPFFLHSNSSARRIRENIFAFRGSEHNHFKSVENSFTIFNKCERSKNMTLIPNFHKVSQMRFYCVHGAWVYEPHIKKMRWTILF